LSVNGSKNAARRKKSEIPCPGNVGLLNHAGVTRRGRDQPVFLGESDSFADPTPRADLRTRGNFDDRVDTPVLRHAAT